MPNGFKVPNAVIVAMTLVLAAAGISIGSLSAGAAPRKALIDAATVSGSPSQEEQIATNLGFAVTVVDDATWASMTAADFGSYDLLIAGDPTCGSLPAGLVSSASVFGSVVLGAGGGRTKAGNRAVVGTDPVQHDSGDFTSPNARGTVIRDGIGYAAAGPAGTTGMYFDTTCAANYNGQSAETLTVLDAISAGPGAWTLDATPPCGGNVSLIAANPAFADLTTTSLAGWSCSVHESFPTFPSDFSALAVATDTATTPTCGIDPGTGLNACGEAYVLIAGSSIVVASEVISVSPLDATNPAGTSHTVTANVHAIGGSPVVVGQHVDFAVTGQNAGVTGTCVPADCKSDVNGNVAFTYVDSAGVGDDTIKASFTDNVGALQTATAEKHWIAGTTHTLTVNLVGSGSVVSAPTGIDCGTTCSASFTNGANVGLTPTPAAGFTFSNWSGACTGSGSCNVTMNADQSVTATFTAIPVNHAPVADPQSVSTPQNTPVPVTLTGTDADFDPLTFAVASGPSHGTLSGTAPNLTYTPNSGYTGADSFTFTANDGKVDSIPATIAITVTASGKPPKCHFHGRHSRGEAWHVEKDDHWLHLSNDGHGHDTILILVNRRVVTCNLGDGESRVVDIGSALHDGGDNRVSILSVGSGNDAGATATFGTSNS